jgi:uncharacterized protein (DUF1697 family)
MPAYIALLRALNLMGTRGLPMTELAIIYSVNLGGYRKAVEDSLAPTNSKRWREALKKIDQRRAQAAASSSRK